MKAFQVTVTTLVDVQRFYAIASSAAVAYDAAAAASQDDVAVFGIAVRPL